MVTASLLHRHPISSTVYGANALVVKPANSLSPMLVVAILNHFGYEQLKVNSYTTRQIQSIQNNTLSCCVGCGYARCKKNIGTKNSRLDAERVEHQEFRLRKS